MTAGMENLKEKPQKEMLTVEDISYVFEIARPPVCKEDEDSSADDMAI